MKAEKHYLTSSWGIEVMQNQVPAWQGMIVYKMRKTWKEHICYCIDLSLKVLAHGRVPSHQCSFLKMQILFTPTAFHSRSWLPSNNNEIHRTIFVVADDWNPLAA